MDEKLAGNLRRAQSQQVLLGPRLLLGAFSLTMVKSRGAAEPLHVRHIG